MLCLLFPDIPASRLTAFLASTGNATWYSRLRFTSPRLNVTRVFSSEERYGSFSMWTSILNGCDSQTRLRSVQHPTQCNDARYLALSGRRAEPASSAPSGRSRHCEVATRYLEQSRLGAVQRTVPAGNFAKASIKIVDLCRSRQSWIRPRSSSRCRCVMTPHRNAQQPSRCIGRQTCLIPGGCRAAARLSSCF